MLLLDKQRIAARLETDEGTGPTRGGRFYPYVDTAGKLTVGTGRNLTAVGISEAERAYLLNNDILDAVLAFGAYPWFETAPAVIQDVLVCIMFNLGAGKFAEFKQAIAALAQGDYKAAAEAFHESRWDAQVGHRAAVYEDILRSGEWPTIQ